MISNLNLRKDSKLSRSYEDSNLVKNLFEIFESFFTSLKREEYRVKGIEIDDTSSRYSLFRTLKAIQRLPFLKRLSRADMLPSISLGKKTTIQSEFSKLFLIHDYIVSKDPLKTIS